MKIKEKNQFSKKEAVKYSKSIIIALFLVTSIFYMGIPAGNADNGSFAPKTIWGYVTYCNGGAAIGASVVVSATGYDDETDTTDSVGAYQVDIGPDTGTEWPDGTSFTVTATLSGWSGSNTGTVAGSSTRCDVTLDPPTLVASADASPTTIVAGGSVNFDGEATGGATPYTWSWNFGGDGTSTLEDPTHTFNTPGTYNCVLTVTDACSNPDTDNVVITVNSALSCDAGGPYSGTICSCVQFDGTPNGGIPPYTFSWDYDNSDGIQEDSTLEDPCAQYDSDGVYTATFKVTDSEASTATDTAQVTISTPGVVADAGGPYSGTVCDPVSFSGSASGGCPPYSYSWTFGDGGSGSGQFPSHQYTSDDVYTATVTVTDDKGATDSDTASVTISTPNLVADADGPYDGYTGIPVDFTGSASGGCTPFSYSWTFGDGGTSNQQNPSYTYDDPGEYTVTLTVTDDKSDTDVDTTTASILPSDLDVDAGGNYYGEVDVPIQFNGDVEHGIPPYSWDWDFGDGTSHAYEQNPTHTYTEPSPPEGYIVTLYVSDSTDKNGWDQVRAYITGDIEEPVANAGGPYEGFIDEEIQFSGDAFGGTPPYSYSWDFDDSDGIQEDSTEQNPTYIYDTPGIYTVTLTVTDDNGKTDDDTATVTISELMPNLECSGSLSWSDVQPGTTIYGNFTISNNGGSGTELDWEITSYPEWGTWTITPSDGLDLTPEDGAITVEVTLVAPKTKIKSISSDIDNDNEYTGDIKVVNSEDTGDYCEIPVTLVLSKSKMFSLYWIYEYLIYHFPFLERILNQYFN
jgi:PKD repeat protein